MSIAEAMIGEFTHESVGTRTMLERIPEDKLSWKPHEKSMTMGRLAGHLAEIPEWAATVVNDEVFDMVAANYKPKDFSSKKDILDYFDKNVQAFKEVLSGQTDGCFGHQVLLRRQGHFYNRGRRPTCAGERHRVGLY